MSAFTNKQVPTEGPPVFYTGPDRRYAAPSPNIDAPFMDNPGGGWAPDVNPDGLRRGLTEPIDFRPSPGRPPEDFYRPIGAEEIARHGVEDQDADGWEERKGTSGKPTALDPRRVPPAEPRPTPRMAPRTYSFTRPFDVSSARLLNGLHFSMADHRRKYEILGMQPVQTRRNTFRIEPTPWDVNQVDMPENPGPPPGRVQAVDVPPSGNRGWRLP